MDVAAARPGGGATHGRMGWPWVLAALGSLALPGAPAGAQSARVLSLADALDLASRHNPEYLQARNEIGLGDAAGRQAWGAFLPTLSLSTSTDQSFYRRELAIDDFGNPVTNRRPARAWG
jgi:outer membrane protein TolC